MVYEIVVCPQFHACALNPHAGESGLFRREEIEIIAKS